MNTLDNNFQFGPKNMTLDWKKLGSVNIDHLMAKPDISVLQDNLVNIAFCNIHNEFDLHDTDPNFIKVFLLSQLIIEYLLHSQDYLLEKLKDNLEVIEKLGNDHFQKSTEIGDLKNELNKAKSESHNRKKILLTQQKLMKFGPDSYFKCSYCGKAFMNESFWRNHLVKRHKDKLDELRLNNGDNPRLSQQLEQLQKENEVFKHELKELNVKFQEEVENSKLMKEEMKEKELELKDQVEKVKVDYESKINKMQTETLRLINEANLNQQKSEKTISDLLMKQSEHENIKKISNQQVDEVLQDEIDSLKEYNIKLKQELQKITISQSLADKLKEFKTTSISKSSNEAVQLKKTEVSNESEKDPKFVDSKNNPLKTRRGRTRDEVPADELNKIVEANTSHRKQDSRSLSKNRDSNKIQNIATSTAFKTREKNTKLTTTRGSKALLDNIISSQLKLDPPAAFHEPELPNFQFSFEEDAERLAAFRKEVEKEVILILKSSGIEDPSLASYESYQSASKLLEFERNKLTKNFHGFHSIREQLKSSLDRHVEQSISGQHFMPEYLGNPISLDNGQHFAQMEQAPSSQFLSTRNPFSNWSNSGNSNTVLKVDTPVKTKTKTNSSNSGSNANRKATANVPQNSGSDISEWDDISSMVDLDEGGNSSKISLSLAPRKMPSLGSDVESDVSSILLSEESDQVEQETQHRRNL